MSTIPQNHPPVNQATKLERLAADKCCCIFPTPNPACHIHGHFHHSGLTLADEVSSVASSHHFDSAELRGPIYSDQYPMQAGGDMGCICRTCGLVPAVYLDQCQPCREKSTVDDDPRTTVDLEDPRRIMADVAEYHSLLVSLLGQISPIPGCAAWATGELAAACHATGKAPKDLTVGEVLAFWEEGR